MNGFSLLMVLATVGINGQVETDAQGQTSYVIRIESVLIDQLREGKVVEQNVDLAGRRSKRFRVLITDAPGQNSGFQSRTDTTMRSKSLVEYEAVEMDNGEFEMWVQVLPERLETLKTHPIDGQVPANVPQIHRYKIFVGVHELPSQQTSAPANDTRPPYLLAADNNGLAQAGATSNGTRQPAAPSSRTGTFPSGSTTNNGGFGSTATAPPLANSNTRTTDNRNWRNGPDPSTIQPPPGDRYGSQVGAPTYNNDNHYNTSTTPRYDQYAPPTYGNTSTPTYNGQVTPNYNNPVTPNYNDRTTPNYDRTNQYTYGGNGSIPQSNMMPAQPTQPVYNQNQYGGNPGFGQAQATIAARPETQYTQPAAPPANNWTQPVNTGIAAAAQPTTSPVAPAAAAVTTPVVTTAAKATDDSPKTSTPLILTTLALFTSLGVNAYLGWLAWSFFWRYRDAVNDSARARSYNGPGRQAA